MHHTDHPPLLSEGIYFTIRLKVIAKLGVKLLKDFFKMKMKSFHCNQGDHEHSSPTDFEDTC